MGWGEKPKSPGWGTAQGGVAVLQGAASLDSALLEAPILLQVDANEDKKTKKEESVLRSL